MLTAIDISRIIKKYYINDNLKNIYKYEIIGSEKQFNIALDNFIKSNNKYFTYIINYDYHWVYLLVIRDKYFKLLFYDSFGKNIKYNYYMIIKNKFIKFLFIYNKTCQQICGSTCGIFVIVIYFLIFSLINKNINSLNKILYIIENNDIYNIVKLIEENEFGS